MATQSASRPTTTGGMAAAGPRRARRARQAFAGTGTLLRLALRRDRTIAPAWLVLFAALAAGSASASASLYPTVSDRVQAATGFNSTPAMLALYGRIYDPDSLGAVSLSSLSAFGAALVGLVTVITVVRHTRAEEEAGRLELICAAAVGRYAPLTAVLAQVTAAMVVLTGLTTAGLVAIGLPLAGSVAFGLSWAGAGLAFAAVAALCAQVTPSARAAIGLATAALALAYLLRAFGDSTGTETATWLSPIGWAQQVRPFAGERWWVLGYPLAFTVLVAAAAYGLLTRRDHGAGLIPGRAGRRAAGVTLRGPLTLALRLHRGALSGWLIGLAIAGVVLGSVASDIGGVLDSLGDSGVREILTRFGGQHSVADTFLAAELAILGVLSCAVGTSLAMRPRGEELAGLAEPVLATPVGRLRWAASHVLVAVAGTAALLVTAGLFAGVAHAITSGQPHQIGRVLVAALVHVPAAWLFVGITVALFGAAPGLIMTGWLALAVFLLVGQLGAIIRLPRSVIELSPFVHLPRLPGGEFSATPLVVLTGLAAALITLGLLAFRRRDLG